MVALSLDQLLSEHGKIARYADTVAGVAKAATLIKRGGYIGVALDVASTSLEIREACLAGDERQCRKARYVEGGKLVGSLGGGAGAGLFSATMSTKLCNVVLGVLRRGRGMNACVLVGESAAIWGASEVGGKGGEIFGEIIYEGNDE